MPCNFAKDRSGNFGVISALLLPLGLSLAAIAVDHGALYFEKRETQTIADLTAIAAAARIGDAQATALAMLADNGLAGAVAVTALGATPRDGSCRFPARVLSSIPAATNPAPVRSPIVSAPAPRLPTPSRSPSRGRAPATSPPACSSRR